MSKTIVITGSNSGIGKAMVMNLLEQHHDVIMVARDSDKTTQVYETFCEK
ncbi:MAG: SDR family NAD(P)-dependent oxidoreductase [Vallitaleaceae bacterium]|jgi:short-subunit dehydrogenase|nr:SDR family NAD(P)-dependent oxidoreductase [Vallitaleaceae bacterium]